MADEMQFIAGVFALMDDEDRVMAVRELATQVTARVLQAAGRHGLSPVEIPICGEGVDSAALVEKFLMHVRPSHDAHDYLDDYWNFLWEAAWPEGLAYVIFGAPANDRYWAVALLEAVDRVAEDVGIPQPHCFDAEDFEQFVAEWRADFVSELVAIKHAVEGLEAVTALLTRVDEDTYQQALPHFRATRAGAAWPRCCRRRKYTNAIRPNSP